MRGVLGYGAYQTNQEIMESSSSSNRIAAIIYNGGIFYSKNLGHFRASNHVVG